MAPTPPPEAPAKPSRWRHLRFHGLKPSASLVASSPSPSVEPGVLKQGFLLKKGHRLPTTKERFFELRPHLLSYFRSKQHAESTTPLSPPANGNAASRRLRGVIELGPNDLITPMATSRHWFLIQKLHGPDGKPYKLELRASSPEERQEWIDALRTAARDATATIAQVAREDALERQLTRTFTMLRVRDATLVSTVLRQQAQATQATNGHPLTTTASVVDLRASFQVFHELVLLQTLVNQIKTTWGPPATWSCEQYDTLVNSIALADHQTNGSLVPEHDGHSSVLATARELQYAFEEVPENQRKLLTRREQTASTTSNEVLTPLSVVPTGRLRCPTIYSYLSTFERLTQEDSIARLSEDSSRSSSVSSSSTASGRSSLNNAPLSPRSATLAKYAHLYLEEEGRQRKPWHWDLVNGDDLVDDVDASAMTQHLADRFDQDKIYTYVRHHTMLFVNPLRVLKTHKFTSIYDEHVVLMYAQTPFAQTQLAPHPFAMAKQALFRLFLHPSDRLSMVLSGDSGSGKTELAKELLKYTVLTAQPSNRTLSKGKVVLYTSSTKSTFQMRNEETRTLDLLHAKGVTDYEVVLLDLTPALWYAMTSKSKSKRLPQVHVDGLFFGFYETLQRLEDEEQLRMYFRNPHAAKKLSSVLDSNILLEAFAHAATPLNANSSRYAKRVDIYIAYGRDPVQYQVLGCTITPFLLEKSRVTNTMGQRSFHVLYALVHGLNTTDGTNHSMPQVSTLVKTLHLDGCSSASFRYLDGGNATTSERELQWHHKKDTERFQHIVMAMETVEIDMRRREAIFRVLSAVLWLGNLEFTTSQDQSSLDFGGTATPSAKSIASVIQELLVLESVDTLRSLLLRRRVDMSATGETFDVALSRNQAYYARDTLARWLYETVFYYVVAQLNTATQCPAEGTRTLTLVDLFGFENFEQRNSLEQLCINYMTEKLAVAEQQLVALRYKIQSDGVVDEPVLHLFEHAVGIFATLEEQTVLHRSEGDAESDDQKKNELFVRYLYQRNPQALRAQPSQLKQHSLLFLVPHYRAIVTYDAQDFVKKNSDFVPTTLLPLLETTENEIIREMCVARKIPATNKRTSATTAASGSLTSQSRTQIHQQIALLDDPLCLHCFRPNASGAWTSATDVDTDVLEHQLQAHRLAPIVTMAAGHHDNSFELTIDSNRFQSRYQCLAPLTSDIVSLSRELETSLRNALDLADMEKSLLDVDDAHHVVRVRTLQLAETLELLVAKREYEAATKLQAIARMVRARKWYRNIQADRRELTRELLELYGPENMRKIERTLRKYEGGREHELRAKIVSKKQEKEAIAELSRGIETFLSHGGLDTALLDEVLRDKEIQQQIATSNQRIVAALREMSLHPHEVLPKQLADPMLRTFYQRMLVLLSTRQQPQVAQEPEETNGEALDLEHRVRRLVAKHKALWTEIAHTSSEAWGEFEDRLDEIGDEPEMLVFYADDDAFNETLGVFVDAVEARVKSDGDATSPQSTELNPAELIMQLQSVEFNATLMAAMQGDPFFVDALQSPPIVAVVHQLMTNPAAFAASADGLRSPLLREFVHRLVRLSEETRKHH